MKDEVSEQINTVRQSLFPPKPGEDDGAEPTDRERHAIVQRLAWSYYEKKGLSRQAFIHDKESVIKTTVNLLTALEVTPRTLRVTDENLVELAVGDAWLSAGEDFGRKRQLLAVLKLLQVSWNETEPYTRSERVRMQTQGMPYYRHGPYESGILFDPQAGELNPLIEEDNRIEEYVLAHIDLTRTARVIKKLEEAGGLLKRVEQRIKSSESEKKDIAITVLDVDGDTLQEEFGLRGYQVFDTTGKAVIVLPFDLTAGELQHEISHALQSKRAVCVAGFDILGIALTEGFTELQTDNPSAYVWPRRLIATLSEIVPNFYDLLHEACVVEGRRTDFYLRLMNSVKSELFIDTLCALPVQYTNKVEMEVQRPIRPLIKRLKQRNHPG